MLFIFFSFLQSLFLLSHGGFSSLCYFDAPVLFPSHGGFFYLCYLILKLNTHKYHPSLNLSKNNLTTKQKPQDLWQIDTGLVHNTGLWQLRTEEGGCAWLHSRECEGGGRTQYCARTRENTLILS